MQQKKVALVTGAARRIGATLTRTLHAEGYCVLIHYGTSKTEAEALASELNKNNADTAQCLAADLNDDKQVETLATAALNAYGRLDILINNASSFYPTPIGTGTQEHWDDLFSSNAKAPFFLSQALAPALKTNGGCIINIADIHADSPLKEHTIYCMAKAANVMLTKSLARELAPEIRVNGIAPGAILWPEQAAELNQQQKDNILENVPLARTGHPDNIAQAMTYLIQPNNYVTGQIIAVDGGRTLGH